MCKIYIVQHCQATHHINELTGGWTDTELTELGLKQAEATAKELERFGLTNDFILYSSDLKRARMTAKPIEEYFGVESIILKELREINNGVAANQTKEWARQNQYTRSERIVIDEQWWDESETIRELFQRMTNFQNEYLEYPEKDIVIVSHGVAIGHLIMSYLNMPAKSLVESFMLGKPGGISILSVSPMYQKCLNVFSSYAHILDIK